MQVPRVTFQPFYLFQQHWTTPSTLILRTSEEQKRWSKLMQLISTDSPSYHPVLGADFFPMIHQPLGDMAIQQVTQNQNKKAVLTCGTGRLAPEAVCLAGA